MRSWRGSFVGSTLKVNIESSIFGGKLRGPTNKLPVVGDCCIPAATAAGPVFTTATLPDNQRTMITPTGINVAFIGNVRVDVHNLYTHHRYPFKGTCVCEVLIAKDLLFSNFFKHGMPELPAGLALTKTPAAHCDARWDANLCTCNLYRTALKEVGIDLRTAEKVLLP